MTVVIFGASGFGRGVEPAKITLIANGVHTSMFAGDFDTGLVRQRWSLDGTFLVTYAGALGAANDIPVVLEAAKRLSRTEISTCSLWGTERKGRTWRPSQRSGT
jgi:hypothetical protein